jgi:hypothetical protein
MNKSKDLSVMATKNEDQTKYSHLSKVLENVKNPFIINQNLLEQENERNPDPSCSSAWCTCTYCREMPEGEQVCCKENSERCHSRIIWKMSKKSIYNKPKPYFFQKLL